MHVYDEISFRLLKDRNYATAQKKLERLVISKVKIWLTELVFRNVVLGGWVVGDLRNVGQIIQNSI